MISPMKRVFWAGRVQEKTEVLTLLESAGVIHVEPAEGCCARVADELLKEIDDVGKVLEELEPLKQGHDLLAFPGTPARVVEECLDVTGKLVWNKALQAENRRLFQDYSPWGPLDLESLNVLKFSDVQVRFVQGPLDLLSGLVAEAVQIIPLTRIEGIAVLASRHDIPLPDDLQEVPAPTRTCEDLDQDLTRLRAEAAELQELLERMAQRKPEVLRFSLELQDRKRFQEAATGLLDDGPLFAGQGWIPADSVETLQESLSRSDLALAVNFVDPGNEDAPPTKLKNSAWCRPVECLYSILGVFPGYREPDISTFFLPFMALFAAFLIGDGGYGLLGILATLLAYRPALRAGLDKAVLDLLLILFGSAVIFGTLTNSWFGMQIALLKSFAIVDPNLPAGQEALKKLCFLIAGVHLTIARVWKIRLSPIGASSLGEVGWIMFIWAMLDLVNFLVLGEVLPGRTNTMFVISLSLVLFFTAPSLRVFSMIGAGLGAIALNAAGFLSDIISYIRLWAVGYAGAILAATFNDMIGMIWSFEVTNQLLRPAPMVIAAMLFVAAHLLNFCLSLVAILAHGVRLNLLEFSNHLGLGWTGRPFVPFRRQCGDRYEFIP